MERERGTSAALWGHVHLPLLARAGSKESVEYILQALWRTRRTGLDAADRTVARDALQLPSDAELDPVSLPLSSLLPSCAIARVAGVAGSDCSVPYSASYRHLPAAAAGVPEDTDQAVRQRERR